MAKKRSSIEIWKPIPGCEGWYDASTLGRIRSWKVASGGLRSWERRAKVPHFMEPYIYRAQKYLRAQIVLKQRGKVGSRKVALLVCETFHGLKPAGYECLHWDGDSLNNRASNLRWETRLENVHDAMRHGAIAKGERHGMAILTDNDVREIRRRAATGEHQKDLARAFSVAISTVSMIVSRSRWKHV